MVPRVLLGSLDMNSSEVVVITGASAGVGRATARVFGKRRAKVGLIARGREGLDAAKREIESYGGEAIVLPLDVADADAVEAAAEQVEQTFGPIDIWINNAMLSVFSPIMEMTPAEFKRVTEVTYLGYVYGNARGAEADEGTRPRIDRAGRLGARVSRHSAAVCVLRGEARGSRFS